MKILIVVLALLIPTSVMAQFSILPGRSLQIPLTVQLKNKATGEVVGTATFSGNHIYLRDTKGRHIATVVDEPDGSRKAYDENGKPLERVPEVPKETE